MNILREHRSALSNIEDCFKYDLRRPWVVEDYKAAFKRRFGE